MGYVLGIDLGTTFTGAAVMRDGRAEVLPLGNHAATIPTMVFLRSDDSVLIGDAAERRGLAEPGRLAREFKRRLGDTAPIMLDRTPFSAERLLALVLKQVLADVTERQGGPADVVALTHPANWGQYKIDLLHQAADLAGVAHPVYLTEPVAAALQYAAGERVDPGEAVAVYDLGGGTFDAAVLRKTDSGFELLGRPQGIERLGGIDFDEAVFTHVRKVVGGNITQLDQSDPNTRAALARLRQECVDAKETLSADSDATVPVMLPNLQTQVRITRAEFEDMIRPILRETIDSLKRAIESAGMQTGQVKAILLAGGSSRVPLVGDMVRSEVQRPVVTDTHPKHSVALGAARFASTNTSRAAAPPPPPAPPSAPPLPPLAPPAVAAAAAAGAAGAALASQSPAALAPTQPIAATAGPGSAAAVAAAAAATEPVPTVATVAQPPKAPDKKKGPPWMWIAAGLVLVALVVGGVVVLGGGDDKDSSSSTPDTEQTTPGSDAATTSTTPGTDAPTSTAGPLGGQEQLDAWLAGDEPTADGLVGMYVPQMSAKFEGQEENGITYGPDEIVADHQQYLDQYGAILVDGSVYNFQSNNEQMVGWYLSIVPEPFFTKDESNQWCTDRGFDTSHCFGRLFMPPAENLETNKACSDEFCVGIASAVWVNGTLVAFYIAEGFTPDTSSDFHVHFYFSSVGHDQAGVPGGGPWQVWDLASNQGQPVFTAMTVDNLVSGFAYQDGDQLCISRATSDHHQADDVEYCEDIPPPPGA